MRRFWARNWKVLALLALVVALLLFAPEAEPKFIYTEF